MGGASCQRTNGNPTRRSRRCRTTRIIGPNTVKKIAQHKHPGNEQVVAGLEKALERARHGAVRAAALIVCEHLSAEAFYFGDENARTHLNFGLDMLKHAILNDTIRVHSAQP